MKDNLYRYTNEEDEWLRENIKYYTYPELTRLYNERFGRNVKTVSDHCIKHLGIHRDKQHKFDTGRKDFIKRHPIGHERVSQRGEIFVKVSDDYIEGRTPSLAMNPNYRRKKDIIWESVHGPKPENHLIVFLDMNPQNFNIDNLYCISRTINLMLSKNKWWSTNPEITLAAIKWCELYYTIKEK